MSALRDRPLPPITWWPMLFSIFVVYLPNGLAPRTHASAFEWALTAAGLVAFVSLIVMAAVCWRRRRPFLWVAAPLTLLGISFAGFYPGAAVLCFIFAACLIPWAVNGDGWRAARLVTLVVAIVLCEAWFAPEAALRKQWLIAALFCATSSALYVWVVRMSLNAHRLAMLAERDRIAGDLNGVLGHTLSRVAAKAEMAARHPRRATTELAEIESLSRQALADVRRTIRGYRDETLEREVEYAPAVLHSHGASIPSIFWWPVLLSLFMAYLPGGLEMRGGASPLQWILTGIGMVAFVALLATSVVLWRGNRPMKCAAVLLALIVVALVPYDHIAGLSPEFGTFLKLWWWFSIPVFSALCAAGFICVMSMSLGVHRMSKVSERERIARDLHDVLGHTLSLITLKAELGGRLLRRGGDEGRARAEIADIESVARRALADIRQAIGGEAIESLDAELERATAMLRTAGVVVECRRDAGRIDATHEAILGLAVREAVTNVVRHAQAAKCCISLQKVKGAYLLEVRDDGHGGVPGEGLGLRGMRERIEALGGSVIREISAGTRLTVRLPTAS